MVLLLFSNVIYVLTNDIVENSATNGSKLLDSIDDCSFNQYSFSSVLTCENLKKKIHQFRGNILQHCNKIVFQLKFQSMKINWHFGTGKIAVRVFISLDFVNMAMGRQLFGIWFVFSVRILIG